MKNKMSKFYIGGDGNSSGICAQYNQTTEEIMIDGWFDCFVGIEGESFKLSDFLKKLGVKKKALKKILDNYDI